MNDLISHLNFRKITINSIMIRLREMHLFLNKLMNTANIKVSKL